MSGYSYLFRENNDGIYGLYPEEKRKELIKFLEEIASCRFVFCPRGIGSSSFRLYQSLMVGSIPIITGMNDYPFKNRVNWDHISIRGQLENLPQLIRHAKDMIREVPGTDTYQYNNARSKGMLFWDIYCRNENLYHELRNIVKERLNA